MIVLINKEHWNVYLTESFNNKIYRSSILTDFDKETIYGQQEVEFISGDPSQWGPQIL